MGGLSLLMRRRAIQSHPTEGDNTLLSVSQLFAPSSTSDNSYIINTGINIFSDNYQRWLLRISLADINYSALGSIATAVTCGDESGSPYSGIFVAKDNNNNRIKVDINPGNAFFSVSAYLVTTFDAMFKREGDVLYASRNNGTTYEVVMASIQSTLQRSPRLANVPLMIGGYYDKNGQVGRPFYGHITCILEKI